MTIHMSNLLPDELALLEKYRQSKVIRHAEGSWAVKDGEMVKLWVTDKTDIRQVLGKLREVKET